MRYNARMKVISLQSGSNGNCVYVEAGGVKLLFDAGISGSEVEERLALHGRDATAVDAVLISHDHIDHCRSMGILNRTFGLPIYATAKTYEAAELLLASASKRMRWACLGHLSKDTNTPELALATHRKILGDRLPLFVATRYEASGVMEI